MECNKEEAIRAMQLAEKKMLGNDFSGAQKTAQKAQRLFPDLENISQLLAVCEVHCSAQVKVGTEKDWYRILQTEQTADGTTIKKQYRKLALLLHPDKNKFAGAEAAFKLIGEANMVLSDQAKRSSFDVKYRVAMRTPAPKPSIHQSNGNSHVQQQYVATNNLQSFPRPQYNAAQHPYSHAQANTFWTCCPFCNLRYQFYKDFVNKMLLCQNCHKNYIAHDMGMQGAPPGSFRGQFPNQGPPKVPSQCNNGNLSGKRSSNTFPGPPKMPSAGPAAKPSGESKMEEKNNDAQEAKEEVAVPESASTKSKKAGSSENMNRKRGRKFVQESSESFDTDSEAEDVIEDNIVDSSKLNEDHCPRRSSRQKQNISYKENVSDDDDFVSPPKKSRVRKSPSAGEGDFEKASVNSGIAKGDGSHGSAASIDGHKEESKQFAGISNEDRFPSKRGKTLERGVKGREEETSDHHNQKFKPADSSELNSNEASDPENFAYPDPDFSDFDKDKAENCFAVNQTWAVYDPVDGMPRFYARIKKVFSPGFKLKITWLESDPDDQGEIDWCDKELPVACGKYTLGDTQEMEDCQTFSHQIHCIKGARSAFFVYPRKGETWALFKNWDINWSSDPEKHLPFKFEYVEILSDFVDDAGVGVAYLGRVKGFVSLFQQTEQHGVVSFLIPPNELYRFSHRVPSFRMTGEEREGVPKGSYEFDPVSLPSSFFKFGGDDIVKMDDGSIKAENVADKKCIPASGKHESKNSKRETSLPRKSPKKSHSNGQISGSQGTTVDRGKNDVNQGDLGTSNRSVTVSQADEKINTPKKQGSNHDEAFKLRRSPRDVSKKKGEVNGSQFSNEVISDQHSHSEKVDNSGSPSGIKLNTGCNRKSVKDHCSECFDFTQQMSKEKIKLGQIWALRTEGNVFPRTYAQVKKIESTPEFRVQFALLDPCLQPKGTIQPVCCGTFKIKTEKTRVFPLYSFSHCLNAKPVGMNRYEIYPQKGEIWALYKNQNNDLTHPRLDKGEYDVVEVMEDNDQTIRVVILFRVSGFKSMFKAPRIQRSKAGLLDIPRAEIARFSHQIPAFQHTGESDSRLAGCWELDPLSIPASIIYLD
ncbi:DnaJ domain containing protein [Parasponia andersonii]|uniref:DnaJ domain containing protein n=1 Tax=Parasponia andersonii TaxID=3476 RepID=A0A2P5DL22_PARAD|nr:DnaJ domain containing protein [Parasponia andersonii]